MATKLKELKLDDAHATAILEKAIEYESFTEELPSSKRERIKAASEQVALMVDAWVDDEVTPDNEDEDVAQMGEAIVEIFEIAGIEINEEGEVEYVEPGDVDDEDDDADDADDDSEGDDEAAVDINDIIDGYEEMSAASRVKAIKALELDMEDDDDYNTAVAVYEWEESQDKPSSRVLGYLDDVLPKAADDEAEADEDDDDADDEDEADESAEEAGGEGEWEEPWARYNKQTAVEVKKHLDKLMAKDELTPEMAQYVIDFEQGREKPPTRKRIVDYATKLMGQLEEDGGAEPEEEEQEEAPKPARAGRPKAAAKTRSSRRAAPEPEEDEPSANGNQAGLFVISGGDEPITAYGVYGAMGAVADLLAAGYESVTVDAG